MNCNKMDTQAQPENGRAPSKRGVGVAFGPDVTRRFLADNGLDLLVRSHEVPFFTMLFSEKDFWKRRDLVKKQD